MADTFGGLFGETEEVRQPTGFQTLPGFAQEGLSEAVGRARGFDDELFAPAELTEQQTGAADILKNLSQIFTPEQIEERISLFQDPFEEDVVQSFIGDAQRATRGSISDIGSGATAAGGFGGTRQALLEGQVLEDQNRAIGDIANRIRSGGFQNATQNAMSSIGQQADISGNLFNMGTAFQNQDTARKQSPLANVQFLANLSKLVPSGGGGVSNREEPGMFNRIGDAQKGLSSAGAGFSKIGGFL